MRNTNILMSLCVVMFGLGGGAGCGTEQPSACEVIEDVTYESITEHECGRGEDGPAYCTWWIRFDQGQFEWRYSDVIQTNSYTCDGATIIGQGGDMLFMGTLDFDTGRLQWDGVEYAPAL